jgi:Soluble NSF attachment protein, SNAP
MGAAESVIAGDRPGLLVEEAKRNLSMGFHEAAVGKFRRAYELSKENGALAAAASCLRAAAEAGVLLPVPDYDLVAKGFEEAGHLMLKNEITAFGAASSFANSLFCLLAAGRASTSIDKFEEFKKADARFFDSIDGVGARVIIEAFRNGNRNQTRDRVEGFKEVATVPVWRASLLDKIVDRL